MAYDFNKHQGMRDLRGDESLAAMKTAIPEDLHQSLYWMIARTSLRSLFDFYRDSVEFPEEKFDFSYHVMCDVYEHIDPVARDVLLCLGQVQRNVWKEVPYPYAGHFNDPWAQLIGAGICELDENSHIQIKKTWFDKFVMHRARFVWEDDPYDIEKDYNLNIGIYEVPLEYSKKKPPRYEEYQEKYSKRKKH